jgi:hypothetical protein
LSPNLFFCDLIGEYTFNSFIRLLPFVILSMHLKRL